jgi:large subunit ribosomal protein L28
MSKHCQLTNKVSKAGRNVAHSNTRTPRRFQPNLQVVHLKSEALGRELALRVSTRAIRTVQKHGGLDNFLVHMDEAKLAPEAVKLKRQVHKALR